MLGSCINFKALTLAQFCAVIESSGSHPAQSSSIGKRTREFLSSLGKVVNRRYRCPDRSTIIDRIQYEWYVSRITNFAT